MTSESGRDASRSSVSVLCVCVLCVCCCIPLTSHLSPLTSHLSPLTSHLSPLTAAVVGMQRLRTMIAVLVLRRTKLDVASTHRLPEKHLVMHKVELSMEEQNVYDALFSEARSHSHSHIPHSHIPHSQFYIPVLELLNTYIMQVYHVPCPSPLSLPGRCLCGSWQNRSKETMCTALRALPLQCQVQPRLPQSPSLRPCSGAWTTSCTQ